MADYDLSDISSKNRPYLENLRKSFPSLNPINYRGISRRPLIAYPSCDAAVIDSSRAAGLDMDEDARARRRFRELVGERAFVEDFDDDLLESVEQAREVCALVDDPDSHEIVRLDRDDLDRRPRTLGFDIGYWGGDHFSLICDVWVMPRWHPPLPDDFTNLTEFASQLNSNLLFPSVESARAFRTYYKTFAWAETEVSDEFNTIRVDAIA